ncbi:hypothetical protein E2562_009275 [Oryza meyeriana var. granulata]|uniref:Uncharacterized protein n=1 Tax=Oryza meyeriana var. granulata TaxID=110450 RepID=A0A6G1EAQ9_9ORYZ|nr:hypothetical protein E2562_009275 [Oryza meyeriana var. granulata]
MWTGNLRVFVVILVLQVCLLAMLAAPRTVHGRYATPTYPSDCCPRIRECCVAAGTAVATKPNP